MCIGIRTAIWKVLFYGFVIAVWVGAAAFIGIGIYLAVENPTLKYESIYIGYDKAVWGAAIYIMIIVGACMAGLGFAGFCGARRPSSFLILMFCVTLLVFVAVELAVMIMAGVFQGDIKSGLRDTMQQQIATDYVNEASTDAISKDWNEMQQDLKCCGADHFTDYYFYSNFYKTEDKFVPYTCCEGQQTNYDTCLREASGNVTAGNVVYLYRYGCYLQMELLVEDQTSMIVATGCIVAGLQIGGFLIGCFLRDNLKKTGKFNH